MNVVDRRRWEVLTLLRDLVAASERAMDRGDYDLARRMIKDVDRIAKLTQHKQGSLDLGRS